MRPLAAFHRKAGHALPTLAVLALALAAQWLGAGNGLDRRLHDAFLRASPAHPPPPSASLPDVAVVTLDPRSLRALDEWPWPRHRHATAIERLEAAGAVAIAFDIDFSAPSNAEDDALFARRIAASGRVALATFSQTETMAGGLSLEIVNRPIEPLARAAGALGNVLVPIEADGVVREVPPAQSIAGTSTPSLARAALRLALPAERHAALDAGSAAAGSQLVDYRRFRPPIPTLAYVDLVEGRFDPERVAGRAVFIGATAAEFQDLWATPVDPALPGVFVQAIAYRTAAAALAGEATLRPAPGWGVAAALALLAALLHPRRGRSHLARALLFAGTALAIVGLGWLSLWQLGLVWPATVALAVVATQYALGIEGLERHVRHVAEAHASSLDALARVGDLTTDVACGGGPDGRSDGGLEIALRLLGDVVAARGVVLLRVDPSGRPTGERLEWRPDVHTDAPLRIDTSSVDRALEIRQAVEVDDLDQPGARVVYSPLAAGSEIVGVLVVFCRAGQELESRERRTIATVGAQLALTAQNLQLIERLRETFESSIAAVASAVEARDGYTDQHCRRLAAFSSLMGTRLGMPADEIRAMELGALLHDVGKIGIRDAILNKPDRLLPAERREMERHPEIGAGIVAPVVGLEPTTLHCILHHHECWDGSGYPKGLAGRDIPLAARIVSIVDVWDALSTSRPYKPAFAQEAVRDLLRKGAGTQFDPELVELFFEILDEQGEDMLALVARSTGEETVR
ncbi:MAG: CHASE2 domain-containing protein [Deltaproteobacteria bacterium]|nr:CHASE2 domain-containing protein [Deltaproteobacteria bacterium]